MNKTAILFENTYIALPENFYSNVVPAKIPRPKLLQWNKELALQLGLSLEKLSEEELALIFSGQKLLEGSQPLAMAYAGHQFGNFVPQLGDGRAILLGEILTPDGQRFDVQLKGSGITPFSRRGDGKSAIGPVIREYILSEAMFHLGVPGTRALAAVGTGENVQRETELPGAILTRVASSHIRIGHFEFFAAKGDTENLKILADYSIHRHFPEIKNEPDCYFQFFKQVVKAQASLIAHWMDIGFIHGVMNTDNMLISGETIDFGPCAFMDHFNFNQVYSSIDRMGRYSYNNQPAIAQWNLAKLAACLMALTDEKSEDKSQEKFSEELSNFGDLYEQNWTRRMGQKLGFAKQQPQHFEVIKKWLEYLQTEKLDYTSSFRSLGSLLKGQCDFESTSMFKDFESLWKKQLGTFDSTETIERMNQVNPIYIPRNHQVERAIQGAIRGDLSVFQEMLQVLRNPFTEQAGLEIYKKPPLPGERVLKTFCGT